MGKITRNLADELLFDDLVAGNGFEPLTFGL